MKLSTIFYYLKLNYLRYITISNIKFLNKFNIVIKTFYDISLKNMCNISYIVTSFSIQGYTILIQYFIFSKKNDIVFTIFDFKNGNAKFFRYSNLFAILEYRKNLNLHCLLYFGKFYGILK